MTIKVSLLCPTIVLIRVARSSISSLIFTPSKLTGSSLALAGDQSSQSIVVHCGNGEDLEISN